MTANNFGVSGGVESTSSSIERKWNWKDKLHAKLFPLVVCELPEAPTHFEECIVTRTRSRLSIADRLRVLLTGKVEVETRIVAQFMAGETRTKSVLRAGRFL